MTGDVDAANQHNPTAKQSWRLLLLQRAERVHSRIRGIRQVPLPAIGIISLITVINFIVWVVAGIVLVSFTPVISRLGNTTMWKSYVLFMCFSPSTPAIYRSHFILPICATLTAQLLCKPTNFTFLFFGMETAILPVSL
jgi:hypothetical protein